MENHDTITAISTPPGTGAIAVVRMSGSQSIAICDEIFHAASGRKLKGADGGTLHYGTIRLDEEIIDEVVVAIFRAPHSYSGEDVVEISCHGSLYIQKRMLEVLVSGGARLAKAGEFTLRAFMNGKLDLTQVEAVADLIASGSKAAHQVAINQMRGGFTLEIKKLRDKLLSFISLIELELDFGEEDVEFADRHQLIALLDEIGKLLTKLRQSFLLGNVIKYGIPVAIAGKTNAGKSTLLNLLLREEKAIVSEIEGTTRDAIEDLISIRGLHFRLIDTAGIRHTEDAIEKLGIERSWQKIRQASVILQLIDASVGETEILSQMEELNEVSTSGEKNRILVLNKIDKMPDENLDPLISRIRTRMSERDQLVPMSARSGTHLGLLEDALIRASGTGTTDENDVIITNVRHYEALDRSLSSVLRVAEGLKNNLPGDMLAQDIRETLHYLGEITGEITDDEILGNIFRNFCIGK